MPHELFGYNIYATLGILTICSIVVISKIKRPKPSSARVMHFGILLLTLALWVIILMESCVIF